MPTVKLRFPGGRYHATPWGHHVNEGLIEWPPSPWRLLRAFIACGFSSQVWSEVPPVARQLIDKLAAVLPLFSLPATSAAHSRHFMPTDKKPKLVFDTWANVGDGELYIHWPCELEAKEEELLGKLVSSLGYLGRSESWVEAQLTNEIPTEWNAVPCVEQEHRGPGWEQVSLMAAISPRDYSTMQQRQAEAALAPFPLPEGKKKPTAKLLKDRDKAIEPYPKDLIDCLTKDTAWWKGHKWSQPPGSQRVLYWRKNNALQVAAPIQPKKFKVEPVEAFLLALTTPTGNRSPLPHVHRTLPQAELLRQSLISKAGNGQPIDCPSLLGKVNNERIKGSHDHIHILPLHLDDNEDQRLDHLLLYAKMGFCELAQNAIRKLKKTYMKGGVGELQVAIAVHGNLKLMRSLPFSEIRKVLAPQVGSTHWVSRTPFVLPRYPKNNSRDSIEGQVEAELRLRNFPKPTTIEVDKELSIKLRHFVRSRSRGGVPPKIDEGYGIRIVFAEPVEGPICLGYGAHFGLGLFEATI